MGRTGQPHQCRGREIMKAATRRTIIAAGALTAAGLFGSLPYHGPTQAMGVPVQHHDVALVDVTDATLLTDEGSLDSLVYQDLSTGATSLYNAVETATNATDANAILGAGTLPDYFDNLFDGAYNNAGSALLLDTWATEDEFNQLLGISATTSETAILANIAANPVLLPAGDTLPAVGSAGFDSDLINLANADYTTASTDFTNYLEGLTTSLSGIDGTDVSAGLTAFYTELSTLYTADAAAVTTDLNTVLTDFGDLGGLSSILGDLGSSSTVDGLGGILGTLLTDLGASLF
jgi:hypothetical protein